jgi:hypothetical protein
MSIATWKRLTDLEKDLDKEYANDATVKACPAGPRVHLVFAHFAARPDVDKAMSKWRFSTLDAYGKASEPHHERPARDYLGAHYLWVASQDGQLDELPNLTSPVAKTALEGGTLVHFKSTNFEKEKVPTKVTASAKIPDFKLVDGYAPPPAGGGGATPAAQPGGATPTTHGGGATPTQPAAGGGGATPAATTTVTPEGASYPTLRRLCLSVPGSTGDHKDVDAKGATVSAHLAYPVPPQDGEMRLLAVSPGFKFTVGGAEIAMTDPWAESSYNKGGRASKPHGEVVESSSGVSLGSYGTYGSDYGLMKEAKPSLTRCSDLAARYKSQLGSSRVLIFKAMNQIEGAAETIQTYEPRQSWGINQWTSDGELWQILAFISDFFPEAFARRFGYFGFGIWFSSRKATWRFDATYEGVIPYLVPCCGPKTRAGIDALFPTQKEIAAAAAAPAPTADEAKKAADKPPVAQKKMANAFSLRHIDATSYAFSYMLTAAGADPDIQKAQAQWMSYRITSVHKNERMTNREVYYAFQADLRPAASELEKRKTAMDATLAADPTTRGHENDTFSDADATDKDFYDWPTRCKNAGKSTGAVAARQQTNAASKSKKARKRS